MWLIRLFSEVQESILCSCTQCSEWSHLQRYILSAAYGHRVHLRKDFIWNICVLRNVLHICTFIVLNWKYCFTIGHVALWFAPEGAKVMQPLLTPSATSELDQVGLKFWSSGPEMCKRRNQDWERSSHLFFFFTLPVINNSVCLSAHPFISASLPPVHPLIFSPFLIFSYSLLDKRSCKKKKREGTVEDLLKHQKKWIKTNGSATNDELKVKQGIFRKKKKCAKERKWKTERVAVALSVQRLGYGLDDQGSIPCRGMMTFFSLRHRVQAGSWSPLSLLSNGYLEFLLRGKAAGPWSWPLISI
jgi:hypothetical protein